MSFALRRLAVAAVIAAAAATAAPSLGAQAAPAPTVTTHEAGCTEEAFARSLFQDTVDPLVPDGLELTPIVLPAGSRPRVLGFVNVVTCTQVTTDGPASAYFRQHPSTTTFILSAALLNGTSYVLLYATDNPVLAARYRQLGWPVELLTPKTGSIWTTGRDGSPREVWSLQGPGLDGTVDGSVPATLDPAEASTFELVHESNGTLLHLCYANFSSSTPNTVWFDLSNTPAAKFVARPALDIDSETHIKVEISGYYGVGGWTATLTTQACPA
jgi:hypothetical protein